MSFCRTSPAQTTTALQNTDDMSPADTTNTLQSKIQMTCHSVARHLLKQQLHCKIQMTCHLLTQQIHCRAKNRRHAILYLYGMSPAETHHHYSAITTDIMKADIQNLPAMSSRITADTGTYKPNDRPNVCQYSLSGQ